MRNRFVVTGELYICDFGEPNGNLQGGIRPCVIVSNSKCCTYSPCVYVVPITTQTKNFLPMHYLLTGYKELDAKVSTALCEQSTLVNKTQLGKKIGKLTEYDLYQIIQYVKRNFG